MEQQKKTKKRKRKKIIKQIEGQSKITTFFKPNFKPNNELSLTKKRKLTSKCFQQGSEYTKNNL